MSDIQIKSVLIEQLIEISKEAGKAILEVYNTNFDYKIKEDSSPLTKADTLSNHIIFKRLKALTPDIPILSEESSNIPYHERSKWNQYWLIDPLDGTKEFIKRNGEFTVNIALIDNHKPIFGVIYAPVLNQTFWGSNNNGSFKMEGDKKPKRITVSSDNKEAIRIVSSRSHLSNELVSFQKNFKNTKTQSIGSSLKFCLVASGKADIYPRLGPTSEWDTAAGHAIARFAGGVVMTMKKEELSYNQKESLLNPHFFVSSNIELIEEFIDRK